MQKALGQYRILERLGSGAMGDVYVAEDTKLGRKVAIKMLPSDVADSPERRKRLEREARVVAALNHPNIVTVFSVEEAGGAHFITMELVEGTTLRELLPKTDRKRFFEIAVPLADAVGMAHRQGLIHRDLKPENIMRSDEGLVKVLDFGLAKLAETADESALSELATQSRTEDGVLVGTIAYMSPEQAEGKPIDERSDIFALGIIFYEMLVRRHPFREGSAAATLSSILRVEPAPLNEIDERIPHELARIVKRCLEKEPGHRYQSAIDLRNDLEEVRADIASGALTSLRMPSQSSWRKLLPWVVATAAIATAAFALLVENRSESSSANVRRFLIHPPAEAPLRGIALLSPDGSNLLYRAQHADGIGLYVRPLDELTPRFVAGTEGASQPFFSADGNWIGFQIQGRLKRVPLSGGEPVTLCEAPVAIMGGSWGSDGHILFGGVNRGLQRVPSAGGSPETLFEPDSADGDLDVHEPQLLPDGRSILYTLHRRDGTGRIEVYSLSTRERKVLVENGYSGSYASSGHLLYGASGGILFAAPFDLDRLEVTGPAVRVREDVLTMDGNVQSIYSVASDGTLAYVPEASPDGRALVWVARDGSETPIDVETRAFDDPRLSPDGTRLAVAIRERDSQDIWIYDFRTESRQRLTFDGFNEAPIWTPDGARITFTSNRDGPRNLYWKPADGSGNVERLTQSDLRQWAGSWSPDGQVLVFTQSDPTDIPSLQLLRRGDERVERFAPYPGWQDLPVFSPDGRWIAYGARGEIFVHPFPGPGSQIQISPDGGYSPMWGSDGRELLYRREALVVAVPLQTSPSFSRGRQKTLFEGRYVSGGYHSGYDVASDGRLVMIRESPDELTERPVAIMLNWFEDLRRRVPSP